MTIQAIKDAQAKQIKTGEEIVGKTIKEYLHRSYGACYLLFTDGTYVGFESHRDYDGDVTIDVSEYETDMWILKELGLITQEDIDKQAKANDRAMKARSRNINMQELERLVKAYPEETRKLLE